jgi:ABC-type lipoprotein release transport system permease subunit
MQPLGCALAFASGILPRLGAAVPGDPLTFVVTAAALLTAAAVACWLPAQRATQISPALILREG